MPCEDTKIFEFNQYQKFIKTTPIIYEDLESLIKKMDRYKYNSEIIYNESTGTYSLRVFNVYDINISWCKK